MRAFLHRHLGRLITTLSIFVAVNATAAPPDEVQGEPPPLNPAHLRADAPDEPPPPPPGVQPASPSQGPAAANLAIEVAPEPAEHTDTTASADALTAENMATLAKPKGFRYSIIRNALVDEVTATILYVRKTKKAKHTKAVPIPKDRKLLAACLAGGATTDLVKGATVTVKYDPRGVVRPQIVLQAKANVELLENATVLDRGGSKLYVMTADKQRRGFEIEGGAKAWNNVVVNDDATGLLAGAVIDIAYDPSGREPLKITMRKAAKGAKKKRKGCGCEAHGPRSGNLQPEAILFFLLLLGILFARRAQSKAAVSRATVDS